jgi:gluconokinase
MHNFVLLDSDDRPLTPVFTWLDKQGHTGVEYLRARMGPRFHQRTGCRFHPMFPVFKLAALRLAGSTLLEQAKRIVSVKTFLNYRLTGVWMEDHGLASASGLFNLAHRDWDRELLLLAGVRRESLPGVESKYRTVGGVTAGAAAEFALPQGTAVINGSGDGFFAHAGSACETAEKISISLGTSAVVRQTLPQPVLETASGTFCYQAGEQEYLLGCAGNNGGNVLLWSDRLFGTVQALETAGALPVFLPLLHGERSPEWEPRLT